MGVSIPAKYIALATASLLMTLFCFWLMQFLISTELSRVPDMGVFKITTPILAPIRPKERDAVREKAKKVLPSEPPPTPDGVHTLSQGRILTQSRLPVRLSIADILGKETIQLDIVPPIKDLVPIVVVHPVYPFVAMMKEIEGFVLVQFSIRRNGTVTNAIVVESEPRSTFDDAALSAIRKFKFQPREVGGDPIPADEIQIRFAFTMESFYAR